VRKKLLVSLGMLLTVAPFAYGQVHGSGANTGDSPQNATALVTITIPAVVGIDVESDIYFDFRTTGFGVYTFGTTPYASASVHASTAGCPSNTWPPPPGCTGTASYDPQVNVTTGAPAGAANHVWLAVFSTKSTAPTVSASLDTFTLGSIKETDIYHMVGSANNAPLNAGTIGKSGFTAFTNTLTSINGATPPGAGSFGWTRVDQLIQMQCCGAVANASSAIWTAGTVTPTMHFQITAP
jgi:hypothetical protein